MKKMVMITVIGLLAACAQMGGAGEASDTTSAKMRACLMSEANSRYQAGTLFTNSIKATATDMVKTCSKKLALQAAGISAESQSTAENIISNLKNLAGAQ